MKWRKASERLPDENEPIVYRNSLTKKPIPYRKVSFSESFGNKWIRFYLTVSDITNVTVENVEWLDESTFLPSSSVTGEEVKYAAMSPNNTELIQGWYKDAKGSNFQLIKINSPVTGESEAIGFEFLHWIFDNHYSRYWGSDEPNKNKWYKSFTKPDRQYYTDSELYNLYKQSKK